MQSVCHTGLAISKLDGKSIWGRMCDTDQDRQKEKFVWKTPDCERSINVS